MNSEPIKNVSDINRINEFLKKNNKRDYTIWQIGLNSGLRISDILRLNVLDVRNKEYITIKEQKTGKYKKFPINENLRIIINNFIKGRNNNEPLFIGKQGNRLNRTQAYRFIKNVCKVLNINVKVGTHTMRKTFGYHHYQQFKDPIILQKIFNHSSQKITLIYIGVDQDEIDKSYKSFHYNYKNAHNNNIKPKKEETLIIKFLKNYINNGGIKHRDFAELALAQIGGEQ